MGEIPYQLERNNPLLKVVCGLSGWLGRGKPPGSGRGAVVGGMKSVSTVSLAHCTGWGEARHAESANRRNDGDCPECGSPGEP